MTHPNDPARLLADTVYPAARPAPPPAPDPLAALARSRRDPAGRVTVWPTCALTGNTNPVAQVVAPIDPTEVTHDPIYLVTHRRAATHAARVLAEAVWLS